MATTVAVDHFVAAAPERVFALASDFANLPKRIPDITKVELLTGDTVGVGTRFRETRVMFGKEAVETMEVAAFDPPHSYVLVANSCGARYESTLRVEPEGGGARLSLSMTVTPTTFFARLMKPMAWLMRGMLKKCFLKDLQGIAKAAEAGPAA